MSFLAPLAFSVNQPLLQDRSFIHLALEIGGGAKVDAVRDLLVKYIPGTLVTLVQQYVGKDDAIPVPSNVLAIGGKYFWCYEPRNCLLHCYMRNDRSRFLSVNLGGITPARLFCSESGDAVFIHQRSLGFFSEAEYELRDYLRKESNHRLAGSGDVAGYYCSLSPRWMVSNFSKRLFGLMIMFPLLYGGPGIMASLVILVVLCVLFYIASGWAYQKKRALFRSGHQEDVLQIDLDRQNAQDLVKYKVCTPFLCTFSSQESDDVYQINSTKLLRKGLYKNGELLYNLSASLKAFVSATGRQAALVESFEDEHLLTFLD